MTSSLKPGLYERLITHALERALAALDPTTDRIERTALADPAEAPVALAHHVYEALLRNLRALSASRGHTVDRQVELCNRLIEVLNAETDSERLRQAEDEPDDRVRAPAETLLALARLVGGPPPPGVAIFPARPLIPLGTSDLLVNARGEPGVGHVLRGEIASADRIDLLCAFIKWNGFRLLEGELRQHLQRRRSLRVITTTYIGATERRAIDLLASLGAEIKVSYETRTTRLHAKAWLFHRDSGFSTAYVGSSNLSHSALLDGLEWNVRLSQVDAPDILEKFRATFESYWEDALFESYDPDRDAERFDRAIASTRSSELPVLADIDVRPYPHQAEILEKLQVERDRHGRHRNLVVAATGTGKTFVAAFDYRRLCRDGSRPSLLFVAHRKEILEQSLAVFRAILRDGAFGELYVDGHRPEEWMHVFASIQSLAQVVPERLRPEAFRVIVVDEFHHAEAPSYRRLLEHVRPDELLGLTATPERSDGESVVKWFDDRIAAELRLWDALERGLLSPFQYFGVSDNTDLSAVRWTRGGVRRQ